MIANMKLVGRPDELGEPLLSCGIELTGLSWLHPGCWEAWFADRKEQAAAALAARGITERRTPS